MLTPEARVGAVRKVALTGAEHGGEVFLEQVGEYLTALVEFPQALLTAHAAVDHGVMVICHSYRHRLNPTFFNVVMDGRGRRAVAIFEDTQSLEERLPDLCAAMSNGRAYLD